jgi:uncharacterized membrane protein
MSLQPLFSAGPLVTVHALAALAALAIGLSQLALPKGTPRHRALGYAWSALLVLLALTSLGIHGLRILGPFSPIHILSVFTLVVVPLAIVHARRHDVRRHRIAMLSVFWLALVGAGLFTLLPGRAMHAVVFGAQ